MQTPFHTVGLVGKYDNPDMHDSVCALAEFLQTRGHDVLLASQTAVSAPWATLRPWNPKSSGMISEIISVED